MHLVHRVVCIVATAGAALVVGACDGLGGPYACTASVEPALIVEIRDARTGAALAAAARGIVRDGSYSDSLRPAESAGPELASLFSRRAADERSGTYAIVVERAGYRPWSTAGVRVGRNRCHVETRRVQAALVPES